MNKLRKKRLMENDGLARFPRITMNMQIIQSGSGRDEVRKLMGETDRCCFCDYECPPPTQLEDESRIMGNLMSLYDHIELSHPVAHQWMA